jgi:hypothetical protein
MTFKRHGQTCQVEKMRATMPLEIKIGATMQITPNLFYDL